MAWLSVLYFIILGVFISAVFTRRVYLTYRYVRLTFKVPGPSWWKLLTVYSKKLLFGNTLAHLCEISAENKFKIWGLWTSTFDYLAIISDPDDVAEVFKCKSSSEKYGLFYAAFAGYIPKGSLTLNGDQWKWHRKTINPAFRKHNMDSRIHILDEGSEKIIQSFAERAADGQDVNLSETLDVDMIEATIKFVSNNRPYISSYESFGLGIDLGMELIHRKAINPIYHWFMMRFDKRSQERDKLARSLIAESRDLFNKVKIIAKNRMADRNDSEPTDIIECLAVPGNYEQGITEDELHDEALTIAVGSSETTRAAMKTVLMLLAFHQEVQTEVLSELDSIFVNPNDQTTPSDLQKMKYLEAVLKESLRLYPAIPMIARRLQKKTDINGIILPGNSVVVLNLTSLHRNPRFFENPLRFDPQRFLTGNPAKEHPYCYLPFGAGTRTCTGHAQAMMTLKCLLSRVLRRFRVYPGEGIKSMDDLNIKLSISMNILGARVKLVPRLIVT